MESKQTIFKVKNKTNNFTIIMNNVAKDSTISLKAKGLYYYLMTLPEDWILHKSELKTHFKEGEHSIDQAFNELKIMGYIKEEKVRGENGQFIEVKYTVHESPEGDFPGVDNPEVDNQGLLNTNLILNTDITNNSSNKMPKGKAKASNAHLSTEKKRHKDADWYTDEINLERLEYVKDFFKKNTVFSCSKKNRHYLKDIVDTFTNPDDNTFMDDDFVTAFYRYKETKNPYWKTDNPTFITFYLSIGMV